MAVGPLQALMMEEEALKDKLKERREASLAAGYERRSLLDPETARASVQKSREARRASAPEIQAYGSSARIESLMRPTATAELRRAAAERKRNGIPEEPVKEKLDLEAEETEEQRAKWEKFHHRSSVFQQDRQKYIEKLRIKQEEKEMKSCTFKPAARRSSPQVNSSCSMFDRARQMEVRKQERMAKIRQELFDKEMAQCSFMPRIIPHEMAPATERVYECYDPNNSRNNSSRRPSASSDRGPGQYATGQFAPARASSAPRVYGNRRPSNSSEGSEYWEGAESREDEISQASCPQEETLAEDVTIMPQNGGAKAPARPPRAPGYCGGPSAAEQEAEQLKVLQRLQERRQLLEETLSPEKNPVAPFNFSGANQFSSMIRQRSASVCEVPEAQNDQGTRRSSAPAAAVAEAVERMEDLLLGKYDELSDLDDSDLSLEEWQDGDEESDDSGLGELGEYDAETPVLGGKQILNCPSPKRGGC